MTFYICLQLQYTLTFDNAKNILPYLKYILLVSLHNNLYGLEVLLF